MERKHIVLLGTFAALTAPTIASAAPKEEPVPRQRLRAIPSGDAAATRIGNGGAVGIGEAVALDGPLLDPVDRYSELIVRRTTKAAHRQEVVARRRDARKERERFEDLPGGVTMATLESIAVCESGDDPEAVSSDGTYRGKYQFDERTWESVGGHGDPAAAPEVEQDYRAALLYAQSGSSPWPICG